MLSMVDDSERVMVSCPRLGNSAWLLLIAEGVGY
jgi:hypothetical protein